MSLEDIIIPEETQDHVPIVVDNDEYFHSDTSKSTIAYNNSNGNSNNYYRSIHHPPQIQEVSTIVNKPNNDSYEIWIGCITLITGTTIGAGILALPTVTYTSGFIPSTIALLYGYIIMTISGLYIAELTIRINNAQMQQTLYSSRSTTSNEEPYHHHHHHHHQLNSTSTSSSSSASSSSLGLLVLYHQGMMSQGVSTSPIQQQQQPLSKNLLVQIGSTIAYFFLHYAMMVAYIAQGGMNIMSVLSPTNQQMTNDIITGPMVFTIIMATSIYTIPKRIMSMINNVLVIGVFLSMGSIIFTGISTIHIDTLLHIQPSYQNPMNVISSLPIIFLAFVYHNIVPFIVKELQYNIKSIQSAIILGTSLPFLMFVMWNAIVLGNIDPTMMVESSLGDDFDPIRVLTTNNSNLDGSSSWLGYSITTFSTLAVITSLIGFTYGLNEAWNDVFSMNTSNKLNINPSAGYENSVIDTSPSVLFADVSDSTTQQVATVFPQNLLIYTLIFVPPLLIALYNPNIFVPALDYGGTFGVTILFLLLPSYILWNLRYNDTSRKKTATTTTASIPAVTDEIAGPTLVPGGNIPMIGLWITAIALMLDQIVEKLDI